MTKDEIIRHFESMGAELLAERDSLKSRLEGIDAYVFDWDGVFNDGYKYGDRGSPFTEIDSMGLNLLRLAYWQNHERRLPLTGIITGAVNTVSSYFARREGLDLCIRGFTNKRQAWELFQDRFNITGHRILFVFDDVLDLPFAAQCGFRILVRRNASPALMDYVKKAGLCEYITAHQGGAYAIREISELILTILGQYKMALQSRMAYDDHYMQYQKARKSRTPMYLSPRQKGT